MVPEYLDIPIFPLPNVTFFAQTYLPLHVFEPRYLKMTSNALAGDCLMGVALLKDGWQRDYFGHPSIHKTFGVGKIVDWEHRPHGHYNIMLEGIARVRLIQEYPTKPYRTAHVQVLQEAPIDRSHGEVSALLREMCEATDRLSELLPQFKQSIAAAWAAHPHPLVTGNLLTAALVVDPYDRQSILEQDEPLRRLGLVQVQLSNLAHQLEVNPLHEEVVEED
jgi:Lon protease-like protein